MTADRDLELVRELHPRSEGTADVAAARRALMAAIDHASREPDRSRARRRGARSGIGRWRHMMPVGAAIAAVLAVVLALSLPDEAANPPSAAAAVLQRAARAAAAGAPRQLRAGEFWYVRSVWTLAGAAVVDPKVRGGIGQIVDALTTFERQVWISPSHPGAITERVRRPITFLSAGARSQWIEMGRPRVFVPARATLPADAFIRPYRRLLALPRSADAMWRLLERGAGRGSASWKRHEMFVEVGDLLRENPVPPQARAALFLAAARIPGIELLGRTRDDLGRPALAIALHDVLYGTREELLFDPRTAALLGERSVLVNPPPGQHVTPGTVRTGASYVTAGIVERIGQIPR